MVSCSRKEPVGFRADLNPEEPTFLGFLTMISLYKSFKKVGSSGLREALRLGCWAIVASVQASRLGFSFFFELLFPPARSTDRV